MARKRREWYPGATYHLMERGIRSQVIFQDEMDFKIFLQILESEAEKKACRIHAYCLMNNHFHLLVETGDIGIGFFMKSLAERYAMFYNRRYGYKGHVFEGRYVSCLVKTDGYFLQTSRYIHLNPVKAKIVDRPEQYRWSSYITIMDMWNDGIVTPDKTLSFFAEGAAEYRELVEAQARYAEDEEAIQTDMKEDEMWLPV